MPEKKYNEEKIETTGLEVAVIGMAGRFPGAGNIGEFWDNLKRGVESISFFSLEELQEAGCDPEVVRHPNYVKVKGILQEVEYFDASFFGYTSKEIGVMDPQMRIFHECVWEALEDAGYNPESYTGRIGLYSGASSGFYWEVLAMLTGIGEGIDPFAIVDLKSKDFLSTRISYKLNLKGPAFTVNTACSTSLLAIHLAVQGVLNGECEIALAGGVGLSLPSKTGYLYKEGMIKSPDGHCRAFSAEAKGIVGGEGAGVVVLKSLEEAVESGDHIYAVVKGSAINNDGIRKAGFHAPSIEGQAEVIGAALYTAEVEPGSIGYIETHGTGTELGDPVEIEALKLAFDMGAGIDKEKRNFCAIGSVKTNIGHLDAAAGVAGFIKAALALKHRLIPPSLHFETPNPKIDFENSPFYVNTRLSQWKSSGCPLRAGVSSFGIGGTNAHVVLEEWPGVRLSEGQKPRLILLSARTEAALDKMTENLANYLKENQTNFENLCYTLQVGRKRFQHRAMLVCTTAREFIDEFASPLRENTQTFYSNQDDPPVVFMFPGQGSQYVDMGLELYKTEKVFREEMDRCFDILESLMNDDIKEVLYPGKTGSRDEERLAINQTEITQPVIFAFEYALAKLLMKWGIKPYAMIGHSIGEFTAACLSGVFSLEDALKLVVLRGKLMQQMPAGSMVSVPLSEDALNPLLRSKNELSLAAVNSSSLCVVSGPAESVDAFGIELEKKGHRYRRLHTSHAFHSKMMDPILNLFESEVERVSLNRPGIPYISNVTGDWITLEEAEDPGYWPRHLRNTVRFADGIEKLLEKDNLVFVEVGPGKALGSFVRQHKNKKPSQMIVNLVRHPKEEVSDIEVLSDSIGRLWLFGVKPDWFEFHGGEKRYRLSLPTYPFERQRFSIPGSLQGILQRNSVPGENRDLTVLMEQLSQGEPLEAASPGETGVETTASPRGLYQRPLLSTTYTAPNPGDEVEQQLARIWQDFFSIKEVGINDDFFELGGDSLRAMIMLSNIHKKLHVEIPLAEFFRKPTVKALAGYIKNAETSKYFSIEPGEDKEYYPLSSAQKRLYFLQQMAPGSTGYNMPLVLSVGKHLDKDKLKATLKQLIARHESLRASFLEVNNVPVQRIHEVVDFEIEYLTAKNAKDREDIIKNFVRPFDLSFAPLIRSGLIDLPDGKHTWMVDIHHIVTDGTSQAILAGDFISLYKGSALEPLRLQYKDFSAWQGRLFAGDEIRAREEYWLELYADAAEIPRLELPADYKRPDVFTFAGGNYVFGLDREEAAGFKELSTRNDGTIYMNILAVLNTLFYRYTGQTDIIIGSGIAGRPHADLQQIIGMFVNTLAMRNYPEGEKTYESFLKEVIENSVTAFENQDVQFEELVDRLELERDFSRNPLFDIMLVVQNFRQAGEGLDEKFQPVEYANLTAKFDATFFVFESGDGIYLKIEYYTGIFKAETVERLSRHFKNIVKRVIAEPSIKLKDIEIISREEKEQLINAFNDTTSEYPGDKTIHELFAGQAEKSGDGVAVVCKEPLDYVSITYRELNKKSNQLAHVLQEKCVGPDTIVGIMVERSLEMVIGILGILKTGAAYLPIDPDYPQERIHFMLKDSDTGILLTTRLLSEKIAIVKGMIYLDEIGVNEAVVSHPDTAANFAYIMYTSGSTGWPKGVLVSHRNVVRLVKNTNYIELTETTRILQTGAPVFDATTFEIWGSLLNGGQLVLTGKEVILSGRQLGEALRRFHINTLWLSAPLFNQLLENDIHIFSSLDYLLVGGDALSPTHINRVRKAFPGLTVINGYGPTENTTFSTAYHIREEFEHNIPIGSPIANSTAYIVDRNGHLQPIGVSGELLVGGDGVSCGYINNSELTAERFFYRSYRTYKTYISQKIYKTGDLARWLGDGNIEFLGRLDQQVKIRGFRVEVSEIENQLLQIPWINEAVVVAVEERKNLCAYIVISSPEKELDVGMLKGELSTRLPDYMIPAYFIRMDRIPLNPNGKVDRKALPEPGASVSDVYVPPRNEQESKLVVVWAEVLNIGKEKIGIDDDFFELGGHSLKAAVLISKIHEELDIEIPLREVFQRPTIRELSGYISRNQMEGARYIGIESVEKREYYALSSAQKRLYFLQRLNPESTGYNISLVLPPGRDKERDKLESSLKQLIARHESLRTSFVEVNNVPVQRVHDEVELEIEYLAARSASDREGKVRNFIRPFDLSKAPLMRWGLIETHDNNYIWMVDIHHIVSDGTSQMILAEDFMSLYKGEELGPLRLQYKDFSRWQNRLFAGGEIKTQEDYWLELFPDAGKIPRLPLPTDYNRPEVFSFAGTSYGFKLDQEEADRFKELGTRNGATLYMNILAVLNTLFYKYTGQTDVIIGSGIAGRPHANLQQIIGMFVNTLSMRNYPEGEKTYESFLKEVTRSSISAFENQDFQFEELVDILEVERDPSRNPLFDISMVVQNFRQVDLEIVTQENTGQVQVLPHNTTAKFDMTFFIHELADGVYINIEYYTGIFKEETIKRLSLHFKKVIKTIIADPSVKLNDIEIISEREKKQVLYEFNAAKEDYPRYESIHRLFAEQVEKAPDSVVAVYEDSTLTYKEADRKANRLARYLYEKKGVQQEERVGIWMSPSLARPVSILGVLKAGAAYVPVDASLPLERIKFMIDDASIGILISEKKFVRDLNRLQWECRGFHTYLCMDSYDIYREQEAVSNELMDEELWHHVGETSSDDITGGGWVSSYTGEPMSAGEMDEYGDNILKKLEPLLHPRMRVLEIGCASGISMYRIAPKVGFYYGTDLSRVIIEKNKKRVEQEGCQNITLSCAAAHEIGKIGENNFDLIIMNSVIQCFHGHNYLRNVVKTCIDLLGENGYLFIGDIMDQDEKEALVRELEAFKRNAGKDKTYTTKTDFSSELFVSRGFWKDLAAELKEIEKVELSGKIYTIENELTRFRYDALISVNKETLPGENRYGIKMEKEKYQEDLRTLSAFSTEALSLNVPSGSLAYIIYTSGTTGKPKGVMIGHRSLVNLCRWHNHVYEVTGGDQATLYAGFGFDASVWEMFPYLLKGASLHIIGDEIKLDLRQLADYYRKHQVTISFLPTQFCQQFMEERRDLDSLRVLLTGGDKLNGFIETRYKLYNNYGPTENTVVTTSYLVEAYKENIPIGKPTANTCVYILNRDNLQLQPAGIAGELCIGGDGLARGYLNSPELTAERFVGYRSYRSNRTYFSKKIYKTGDLARWLADGNIEFMGRIDQQVKIRGFRIEPGEIENRLMALPGVREAVVLDREDAVREKYLCAYVVSTEEAELDVSELREALARNLPDYMVPSYFVQVERIPLTHSGKVDRRALPEPVVTLDEHFAAPETYEEKKLAELWSEILGIEKTKIGIHDNFFELGGHSLKATILTSKVHKAFDVKLPLPEVFKTPCIKELARWIRGAKQEAFISIEPVEKKEYYPMSSAQKRLYVLQQMESGLMAYNMLQISLLEGELDKEKLEKVLWQLIHRHESLRASFHMIGEEPVQRIHDKVDFEIEQHTPPLGHPSQEGIAGDFLRPFDLSQAPLMRLGIIKTGEAKYILMRDLHHIINDGTSEGIFQDEFMTLYGGKALPLLRLQYKEYAVWQQREAQRKRISQQEAYWIKEFEGEIPVLSLPTDFTRPAVQSFEGHRKGVVLEGEVIRRVKQLAAEHDATLFMMMLSLTTLLLAKLSGQEDIVVGTPVAGREHADLQSIIGMFVNTLPLRNHPGGEKTFTGFLKEVRERTLKAFENREYLFEDLVEKVKIERDTGRNPIFDVMLTLPNMDKARIRPPGLNVSPYPGFDAKVSQFDMSLLCVEAGDRLFLTFEYCSRLFKESTIDAFIRYFNGIAASVSDNPHRQLREIVIISLPEKQQILYEFNDTAADYPRDKTIHQLFAEQVEKSGDVAAVVCKGHKAHIVGARGTVPLPLVYVSLTYKELNRKSDQLASLLMEKGVLAGDIIAIMMERSIDMMIGIFAILKAKGAYLPIDPEYPRERIDYMLKDSGARILLTDLSEGHHIHHSSFITHHSGNLAYVIYTSGSTGRPKGVMMEHHNVVNLVWGLWERIYKRYTGARKVALVAPYVFDASVQQIFAALLLGHTLCIVPEETRIDGAELIEFYRQHGIDISDGTPTHLRLMKDAAGAGSREAPFRGLNIKHFIIGGEAMPRKLAEAFLKDFPGEGKGVIISNVYGPTECCVDSTSFDVSVETLSLCQRDIIPIGKVMPNEQIYILNRANQLQPPGVPGELCIAGDGVARGYLNRPELTNKKFQITNSKLQTNSKSQITNYKQEVPFGQIYAFGENTNDQCPMTNDRFYKTGDLARWLMDGNIEFLGRMDHQVKIRGFRIELGEIENDLLKRKDIKEAVVIAREEQGDPYLCAYIVTAGTGGTGVDTAEIKRYLSRVLPGYMVPAHFVQLEAMPLTPNGKVDRKALPKPRLTRGDLFAAPHTQTERTLAEIWADILDVEAEIIGIDDRFFDLGGHSLKATVMIPRIQKEFNVRLTLAEIFHHGTIRQLARVIKEKKQETYFSIESAPMKEYYAVSSAQKRLYILQQIKPDSTDYNMPLYAFIIGNLDAHRLQEALRQLSQRHEILRTSIRMIDNRPVQLIHPHCTMDIEYMEIQSKERNENFEIQDRDLDRLMRDFIRPFDLAEPPLFRVKLIKIPDSNYLIMVDMHHVITDGVSTQIFMREFMTFYAGGELPPLKFQYKDFSEWQNRLIARGEIKKQEEYWLQQFKGNIPHLELPLDYPRSPGHVHNSECAAICFEIPAELTARAKALTVETGTTPYMVLLAVYNILLSRYSGQEDIVAGSALAGRRHPDVEKIMGMFVNMLVMRNYPYENLTFLEFLEQVKTTALNAYDNQDYQFDELVRKLGIEFQVGRNPLFDTQFTFQNAAELAKEKEPIRFTDFIINSISYWQSKQPFDLGLNVTETKNTYSMVLGYLTSLFTHSTIENMAKHYVEILDRCMENKTVKIKDIVISLDLVTNKVELTQEDVTAFEF